MNNEFAAPEWTGESRTSARTARDLHDLARKAVLGRAATLRLPPGVHKVSGDWLPTRQLWISNNDGGQKNVLLDFSGASDLVIDGNGCTLLIEGTVIPLLLENCRNVTVRDLTIDWVRPGFTEVEITASGDGFVEFDGGDQFVVDRGRLVAVGGGNWPSWHLFNLIAFDRVRREPLAFSNENWNLERTHRARALGNGRFRLEADFDFLPPPGVPAVTMHGDRVAPAVVIDRCDSVVLENLTIHHALGMGVIAQVSRDLTWKNVRVIPSGDRLFSTWVDATHAVDCSGFLRMENCEFSGMFDDGTNIHGVYHRAAGWNGPRRVLLETMHYQQWGIAFLRAGDVCRLCDPASLTPMDTALVAEVHPVNARFFEIVFDNEPAKASGRPCVAHRYDPAFSVEISGTKVTRHRGRGFLLSVPGRVHVHDNYLHSSGTAILSSADAGYWWESGPTENVLIENNHFDACGNAMCGGHVLAIDAPPGREPLHGRVTFRNNTIRLARPLLIDANRVAELETSGNSISAHPDYPPVGDWELLRAVDCGVVRQDLPAAIPTA